MPEEILDSLSAAELAEIDGRYIPFPSFGDWPKEVPEADLWQRSRRAFRVAADEATEDDLRRALTIAQRAAAFDTGAIEGLYSTNRGLTFTVAEQAAMWEQKVEEQGADARPLFEAQLRAFELVLDHVTDSYPEVTQAWIRRLHEELTTPQETYVVHTPVGSQEQPLPKGKYKEYPNHVRTAEGGIHAYAPVESTQAEMQRLVEALESAEFLKAHPIIQASYAHYAVAAIHPFADGNGRVARAVASTYTYRDASIPLLVLHEHRNDYLAALAKADAGSPGLFVGFIGRVASETLVLVRDNLQTAIAPQPDLVLDKFEDLFRTEHHGELDQIGSAFVEWLHTAAREQVAALDIPKGINIAVEPFEDTIQAPLGFRDILVPGLKGIRFNFRSSPPAQAEVLRRIDIYLSATSNSTEGLLVRSVHPPEEQLTLKRVDIHPELSSVGRLRVENMLRRLLGQGLEELHEQVRGKLQGTDPS